MRSGTKWIIDGAAAGSLALGFNKREVKRRGRKEGRKDMRRRRRRGPGMAQRPRCSLGISAHDRTDGKEREGGRQAGKLWQLAHYARPER